MFLRPNIQEVMLRRSRSMSSSSSKLPSDATMGSRSNSSSNSDKKLPFSAASLFFPSPKLLHSFLFPILTIHTLKWDIPRARCPFFKVTEPSLLMQRSSAGDGVMTLACMAFPLPWTSKEMQRSSAGDGVMTLACMAFPLPWTGSKDVRRLVILHHSFKVKVPSIRSILEFGVKNKSFWVQLDGINAAVSPPGEMELSSEDYVRVISRGPDLWTGHIFGGRIVKSCDDGFICHRQ